MTVLVRIAHWLFAYPARTIVVGFALLIAVGTVLLRLPMSSAGAQSLSWNDSLFLATSGATVTGLSTIDVRQQLSGTGDLVLMSVVQLGGLGIMGAAFGALVAVGRQLSYHSVVAVRDELGSIGTPRALVRILRDLVVLTFCIEAVVAGALFARFVSRGESWPTALRAAAFNAVTAFCNSGFDVLPRGGAAYVTDAWIGIPLSVAIVLGGLGFPVLVELWRLLRHPRHASGRRRTSLSTKFVLVGTAGLIVLGVAGTLAGEWGNPRTLGALHPLDRLTSSILLGVTSRTAGMPSIPFADMHPPTQLLHILLMFIGTGPVSTGGGIKVTTVMVILLVIRSQMRGDQQLHAFRRSVADATAARALTVVALALTVVMTGAYLLIALDSVDPIAAIFEATSAFSTVGLSLNVTPHLDTSGRMIDMVLMFLGRVGPITVLASLRRRERHAQVRYPMEEVALG